MWPVPSPEHREVLAEISALAPSTKQIFVTSQHKERARPEERQPDLPQKTILLSLILTCSPSLTLLIPTAPAASRDPPGCTPRGVTAGQGGDRPPLLCPPCPGLGPQHKDVGLLEQAQRVTEVIRGCSTSLG